MLFLSDDDTDGSELLTDVDEEMFEELTAPQPIEEEATPDLEPELEDFDLEAVDLDDEEPFIEEPSSDWTVGAEVELEEIEPAAAPDLEDQQVGKNDAWNTANERISTKNKLRQRNTERMCYKVSSEMITR